MNSEIHKTEHRRRLPQMILRLFNHWNLSPHDQAALLGLSPCNEAELSEGFLLADNEDLLARAGHLLGIHKSLRLIFPHNVDLAYRWVSQPNRRFDNAAPLQTMIQGLEGLLAVRLYLDCEREA